MTEKTNNDLTENLGNTVSNSPACSRSRRWCFTFNNWTKADIDRMTLAFTIDGCKYYIVGEEVSASGTPHLQGYVEWKNKKSLKQMKTIIPKAHFEHAKGSKQENYLYCSKERILICSTHSVKDELLKEYINVEWKPWQQTAINLIETGDNARAINWFYDEGGNTGKSFLAKYLYLTYDAIICDGKKDNVCNQIKMWMDTNPRQSPKVVLLDIPRYCQEWINYGMIESIKNGLVYSGKYEGGICCFESPTVLIFSNQEPNYEARSADRWNLITITE